MEKSAIQILLRSALFSYAATAVFLLLLAFGMYRFQWGEKEITLGVRGIYILACFLAGLVAGKKAKRRRFLWGFCAGALYFLIFLALSFAFRQSSRRLPHPCCFPSPSAPEAAPSAVCLANAASDGLNRYR